MRVKALSTRKGETCELIEVKMWQLTFSLFGLILARVTMLFLRFLS